MLPMTSLPNIMQSTTECHSEKGGSRRDNDNTAGGKGGKDTSHTGNWRKGTIPPKKRGKKSHKGDFRGGTSNSTNK